MVEAEKQQEEPPVADELEEAPIEPDAIATGFALAIYAAALTAVVVVAVTRGLLDLQVAFPIGLVLALVVNIGVVAGVMPAMQVWRRTPVLRWLVWGSWAGALVGWATVLGLEALPRL